MLATAVWASNPVALRAAMPSASMRVFSVFIVVSPFSFLCQALNLERQRQRHAARQTGASVGQMTQAIEMSHN
jgi:hypothetical protein